MNDEAQSNVIGPVWNSGGAASEGNVVTANCNGIYIQGSGASGNTVMGNYIGVNADGFTANPNGGSGVVIINGAHNNLIGGTAPSAAALIDPSDQAAYWTLDESTGNRSDSVGPNVLVDNNAVLSASGKINDAADFEASSSQFLAVADNPELSVGNIDFSFAGWVNLESKSDYGTILGRYDSGPVRDYLLQHDIASDRFIFYLYDAAGTPIASVPANSLGAPSLGTWYFIVVWHDSVNDLIGIQVNNGAANTASTSGSAPGDSAASFRMGALFAGGPLQFFDGMIDEWGFWKRLLTSQELTALYNNGDGLPHDQGSNHESNVISANGSVGIYLGYDAHDNHISGNLIGTTLDGQSDLGNDSGGISLSGGADNNVIGIDLNGVGLGNVISGNAYKGISFQESDNNVVSGNHIGTNVDGSAALGNDGDGVFISINSTGNIIGTNGDGLADGLEGNLISANGAAYLSSGVVINASSFNNVVAGNYIGTNFGGTSLLGNNGAGIKISGTDNRIGTNGDGLSDAFEANVISGNSDGVWIAGHHNKVSGNRHFRRRLVSVGKCFFGCSYYFRSTR